MDSGLLVVLSAASGTGKTTLCRRLLEEDSRLTLSISHTTRPPRGAEQDGVEYHFVDSRRFSEMVASGAFVEHAVVHGNCYGTSAERVLERLQLGADVLFDIDVQGGEQLKKRFPRALLIFLLPPSLHVLATRLHGRHTDSEDAIDARLQTARSEIVRGVHTYDYLVVNDDLQRAGDDLAAIIRSERLRNVDRDERLRTLFPGDALPR